MVHGVGGSGGGLADREVGRSGNPETPDGGLFQVAARAASDRHPSAHRRPPPGRAPRANPMLTRTPRVNYSLPKLVRPLDHSQHPRPFASAVPIQTIEPRRLYRQIADQLRGVIERGEFAVGSRLPPERDLAAQLGVSRPSVREALIALEVEGLVEVRMGSGIYVRAPDPKQALRRVGGEGPLETLRARQVIESELAALAARHMKKPQIAGLRNALAMMQVDIDAGRMPTRGDRLFHERIAEACDNAVLQRIVGELFDERRGPLYEQLGSHFETSQSWTVAIAEHHAVIDAIASRSPQAAREAMATHLARSHDRFTVRWPVKGGARKVTATTVTTAAAVPAPRHAAPPRPAKVA